MKRWLSLVLLLGIALVFCTSCIAPPGGPWTETKGESLTIVDYDSSKDLDYPVITGEVRNDHEHAVESVEILVVWYPQSGNCSVNPKATLMHLHREK
jgi:hypothetical protein